MCDPYIIRIFESLLLGSVNNLAGLVDFVNDLRHVKENQFHISIQQRKALVHFCQILDLDVPEEFTLVLFHSPAVLLYWWILLVIIARLNNQDQRQLLNKYPVNPVWVSENLTDGFDSNFHLDRSRAALRLDATVKDLCLMVQADLKYHFNLTGGERYATAFGLRQKRAPDY